MVEKVISFKFNGLRYEIFHESAKFFLEILPLGNGSGFNLDMSFCLSPNNSSDNH